MAVAATLHREAMTLHQGAATLRRGAMTLSREAVLPARVIPTSSRPFLSLIPFSHSVSLLYQLEKKERVWGGIFLFGYI